MSALLVRIGKKIEGHVWFHLLLKLFEWSWAPIAAVAYIAWILVKNRPMEWSILSLLLVLSSVCIVYAVRMHRQPQREESTRLKEEVATSQSPSLGRPEDSMQWLAVLAKADATFMAQRINILCATATLKPHLDKGEPYLDLEIGVLNASVFTVTLDHLDGKMTYQQNPLQHPPELNGGTRTIQHGESGTIVMRQWVQATTADSMRRKSPIVLDSGRVAAFFSYEYLGRKESVRVAFGGECFKTPEVEVERLKQESHDHEFRSREREIWELKASARWIRSQWPLCNFVRRPIYKAFWVVEAKAHVSGSAPLDNREWVEVAIRWRERFENLPKTMTYEPRYLNSLDFEEAMSYLDCELLSTDKPMLPNKRPNISLTRYGVETQRGTAGFYAKNVGDRDAFDVDIIAMRFGKFILSFGDPVKMLSVESGEHFIGMSVTVGEHEQTQTSDKWGLFEVVREWQTCNSYWNEPEFVIRLKYRDSENRWYTSRYAWCLQPSESGMKVISLNYLEQEMLRQQQ
jgi:hypothetical protein